MTDESLPSVCVVTHPLAAAGENATRSLLDILSAVTSVALVTADLPADSEIRDRHELVELTQKGAGDSVVTAAVRFLLNQLRMCRVIADRDEDVVLFFGATSYLLPIIAARLLGKTVLVEPRGDVPLTLRLNWEQQLPDPVAAGLASAVRALERAGFAAAHGVITYTPEMARQLDLHPESPTVYPTGARYVRTDEFRVQQPYADRDRIVGFLGRLDEEKNVRELAAVATELPDDVTFRFIGDGDLREWLETELASEIERGAVELTGWVDHDDVPDQLNDLSLLVLPSQPTEGLPTTILEALACGTPVLASPVSGVPDVVREGETGFLLDSREPPALRQTILDSLDRDDLDNISENGRNRIETEYSFEAACERYRSILKRL
ncbi:glycosyl transferase family 1 [Haloarcula taiwanensis]|uniref:Glycosyl transferase family 1 n=1 Tax=Haloarcula taiwanensis TaxID=1932004 RepID=A0A2H4ZXB3_9EURY|nr:MULTISPECIES: glycosyltransferase family 4 protein [Haloarcula]AUG47077.1 glycosyl transferase family 1 [Haloarcula taiwanensis]RLM33323.1 glycosyltransferase family 1 protein [Haloarcula sp. Atlit-120R]RLM42277.1 glycosyltransferase family 1 protein [Haloarcula sp. Atlit-47R]